MLLWGCRKNFTARGSPEHVLVVAYVDGGVPPRGTLSVKHPVALVRIHGNVAVGIIIDLLECLIPNLFHVKGLMVLDVTENLVLVFAPRVSIVPYDVG